MIYTEMTKKALRLACRAHEGQLDRCGLPYIFHPYHLAEQMDDEVSATVALLHDVVEDTPYTLDDLRAEGFPEEVLDGVALLTHDPAVPYMDYVRRIRSSPLATKVMLADLRHNSDITRLDTVTERDLARLEKYRAAARLLTEGDGA